MSERAVAELIVHLGRITPQGRLRRGPDAGAMDRATLLWARQPLLPDALRLRGIYGTTRGTASQGSEANRRLAAARPVSI